MKAKARNKRITLVVVAAAIAVALLLVPMQALAGEPPTDGLDWFTIGMTLLGGLALFLFGMEQMSSALRLTAGDRIKSILRKLSDNRLAGVATGAGTTAVIQSSSVTTVLVVGFVSAGLMSLEQSLGVILGANIGTTITAQIVAFKVTKYSLLLVAAGFIPTFVTKNEKVKQWGFLVLGLGLVFFGMGVMSTAMYPLRSYEPFLDLMVGMDNPIYAIAVAAAFTGLVQSSSATTGIVIVMATQGLISLEAGIALALGANVGTCVTAGLAAIGKPREAVRAAVAHILFNVSGVLIALPFIPYFAEFLTSFGDAGAAGAAVPRQIANAHTIFNVGMALLFLPFLKPFARLIKWIVPDAPPVAEPISLAKHLDESLASNPVAAIEVAMQEVGEMGRLVSEIVGDLPAAVFEGEEGAIERNNEQETQVACLRDHIAGFLSKLTTKQMSAEDARNLLSVVRVAGALKTIAHVATFRMGRAGKIADLNKSADIESTDMLFAYHKHLRQALLDACASFSTSNGLLAYEILARRELMAELRCELRTRNLLLLSNPGNQTSVVALSAQMEIIEDLDHVFHLVTQIAQEAGPAERRLRVA